MRWDESLRSVWVVGMTQSLDERGVFEVGEVGRQFFYEPLLSALVLMAAAVVS